MTPRSFSLLLAMTPGIGGRTVTKVLARNNLLSRSPQEFLGLAPEAWREEYGLSAKAAANLHGWEEQSEDVRNLERRLNALGVTLVTSTDAHYPAMIESMDPDPPGVLFLYGNTSLLEAKTFAVMSSRRTAPSDLDLIERLVEQGVLSSEVLVVGHNTPEYQRAAVVPLRWGSPRILCLDRGLFSVLGEDLKSEAFNAARLWRYQFDPQTDLAISPFRPEAEFARINNKVRDRLIACLAQRIDFVQVSEGGNMEKLLRMGLKAGRGVRISDHSIGYRQFREAGAEII